jgi:hypothetical protein
VKTAISKLSRKATFTYAAAVAKSRSRVRPAVASAVTQPLEIRSTPSPVHERTLCNTLFLPVALGASAIAVLLIATAYAASRDQADWATYPYWAGELLLFASTAIVVLVRRNSEKTLTCAVLVFSLAQYLVKVLYSPLRLKFPDELQHEQSALGILATRHLFPTNYSLPIGPLYPGLQAAAVGFGNVLGLSLHLSELLVAGLAHLLLAAGVLVLFRLVIDRGDLAALGTLVYCFGSCQAFYNSMFIYQALALPFAVLLVVQVVAILQGEHRVGRLITAVSLSACVVITHHVTALFASTALIIITIFATCHPSYRASVKWVAATALASVVFLVAWVGLVAHETLGYLSEPFKKFMSSFNGGVSNLARPVPGQPLIERIFTYSSVAVPLALLTFLTIVAWRHRQIGVAVLAGSATALQLAVVAIRFAASNGQELAGRAQNFITLYTAIGLAICLGLVASRLPRHAPAITMSILSVLFVGGITSGWPPGYERLPGSYQIASFESAVDSHAVAAGQWARNNLSPGNRFASDFGNLAVIGTIGDQFPVNSPYSDLFYRNSFDPRDAAVVQRDDIQFLLVDARLTKQYPPLDSYSYFIDDSLAGRHQTPVAPEALQKFRDINGVACLFDDGTVQIYGMRGSRYADSSR